MVKSNRYSCLLFTFINGHVHPAQTFLLVPVHVIGEGVSCLLPCLNESFVKGMVGFSSGHMKRSAATSVPVKQEGHTNVTFHKDRSFKGLLNCTQQVGKNIKFL